MSILSAVGTTDIVTQEFIPVKLRANGDPNSVAMSDIVIQEFIPGENVP